MLREKKRGAPLFAVLLISMATMCDNASAQKRPPELKTGERPASGQGSRSQVRSVTIPVTIRQRGSKPQEELQEVDLKVMEDGEEQKRLSIRSIGNAPLSLAVLIQDGVVPSINAEIKTIADFILRLPSGSRVFIGYMRSGALEVRQKFTTDLERAAGALRIPVSFASVAPSNPYGEMVEALKRFESLPAGRRAMLVISDGVDRSRGLDTVAVAQGLDLQRTINEAQRRGVAIYSIYAPAVAFAPLSNQLVVADAQGSLERLSNETGGRAFFQGNGAPVSLEPFLTELSISLARQIALTYLSTHPNKGFHRIQILTDRTDIKLDYPNGYTRR